ncbi:lipid A biosynthesis acyltransferase [Alkalilimnicola ehrlichii MLHE-1]|uniref:Lipid A biosynthesis lauroyl (Or palmitoleoyl) acyltransferase n=1 Tax=Alkalilimnicola ehrlichii (strain ATCC BAA-1101 / DSM 17681 / MLHE-1) TaxID=187272 RepID=Q0A4U2_ALKEH|nr:lipid A biosynthesis acyltransferase [Alkalilimnicola ehrlichii]ABI58145.1 lipid A biosynthesis lauroyl (or palmitoleoyl) acyltransferase [Alkalilimnicola ehrlichii MLHE-1]
MAKQRNDNPAHPGNWGHALGLALLWLIGRMPPRLALGLGAGLGALGYRLARARRLIVRRNLELCFPEQDPAPREALVRANFRYTGRGLAELALSWFGGPRVDRLPLAVEGLEHLRAAQADGSPVILLSGHFTTVEICGRLLRRHSEMAVIYKPMDKRPLADRTMREGRERAIGPALSKDDLRGIVRTLRKGLPVWYAGDQNYRSRQNVFAPFFGIPAATVTGLSRLARLSKARVVPVFYHAREDGPGYRVVFKPALEGFPSGDDQADAERMNRIIEEAVRAHPAQYFWAHRRFKSQPDGDVDMYPGVKDHRRERRRRRARQQQQ